MNNIYAKLAMKLWIHLSGYLTPVLLWFTNKVIEKIISNNLINLLIYTIISTRNIIIHDNI